MSSTRRCRAPFAALLALLACVVACSGNGVDASPDATGPSASNNGAPDVAVPAQWQSLDRPLKLPAVTTADCPVSTSSVLGRNRVRGDGSLRLLGEGDPPALRAFTPPDAGSAPLSVEPYWLWQPGMTDDVLLRGQDLRSGSPMLFEDTAAPSTPPAPARRWLMLLHDEQAVPGGAVSAGWDVSSNRAWVTAPGCYGLQLDSKDFSIVIVTEVR